MMQLILNNCQAQVLKAPDGTKMLQLIDPDSKIVVLVPFTQDSARSLGADLSTGLVVASGPLPTAKPGDNGR